MSTVIQRLSRLLEEGRQLGVVSTAPASGIQAWFMVSNATDYVVVRSYGQHRYEIDQLTRGRSLLIVHPEMDAAVSRQAHALLDTAPWHRPAYDALYGVTTSGKIGCLIEVSASTSIFGWQAKAFLPDSQQLPPIFEYRRLQVGRFWEMFRAGKITEVTRALAEGSVPVEKGKIGWSDAICLGDVLYRDFFSLESQDATIARVQGRKDLRESLRLSLQKRM